MTGMDKPLDLRGGEFKEMEARLEMIQQRLFSSTLICALATIYGIRRTNSGWVPAELPDREALERVKACQDEKALKSLIDSGDVPLSVTLAMSFRALVWSLDHSQERTRRAVLKLLGEAPDGLHAMKTALRRTIDPGWPHVAPSTRGPWLKVSRDTPGPEDWDACK